MSDELKRLARLGAATKVVPKQVEVGGLADLAEVLRDMADAQQRSQQIFIATLSELVAAIQDKEVKSTDLTGLIEAVVSLKQDVVTESNTLVDYEVEVERDHRQLAKKYRFTAEPRQVH